MSDHVLISNIKVMNLNCEGIPCEALLEEGPMYRALLEKDMKIYDDYRNNYIKFCPDMEKFVIGSEEYERLVRSVANRFYFIKNRPIVLSMDDAIMDGQHRLSSLLFLYGKELVLRFRVEKMIYEHPNHYVESRLRTH